jgi:hypothetical protein
MAAQNFLIMNLLRLITPEEIAEIATKHNGGKFLSLTDLVNERIEHKIFRDFSSADSLDIIHDSMAKKAEETAGIEAGAKILPFERNDDVQNLDSETELDEAAMSVEGDMSFKKAKMVAKAISTSQFAHQHLEEEVVKVEHNEEENMSSFILIEKARLKKSQKTLKQKEIIELYQKNSNVDVEQIKSTNQTPGEASEAGVLVNKKQY